MIKQAELLRQQLDLLHPLKFKVHIFKTKTASGLRVILLGGSLSPPDQRLLHWRLTSLIPPLNRLAGTQEPIQDILLDSPQCLPHLELPSAVL